MPSTERTDLLLGTLDLLVRPTAAGRRRLAAETEEWQRVAGAMTVALQTNG